MQPCENIEFFPVVVTDRPTNSDYAPTDTDPVHARLVRASDLVRGDIVLGAVDTMTTACMPRTNYGVDEYPADPQPLCGCSMCEMDADKLGPRVVVTDGFPWDMCDVWPVDNLALPSPVNPLR